MAPLKSTHEWAMYVAKKILAFGIFFLTAPKTGPLAKISPLVRLTSRIVLILFSEVNETISDRFHTFSSQLGRFFTLWGFKNQKISPQMTPNHAFLKVLRRVLVIFTLFSLQNHRLGMLT